MSGEGRGSVWGAEADKASSVNPQDPANPDYCLFNQVQQVLRGKRNGRTATHDFLFRRLMQCHGCGYSLIGERQKGRIYYRCHTSTCRATCVREDAVEAHLSAILKPLQFNEAEKQYFATHLPAMREEAAQHNAEIQQSLSLQLTQIVVRLNRLTDAYLDQVLDKEAFEQRKTALLVERRGLEEQIAELKARPQHVADRLSEFLELAGSAYSAYKVGLTNEKRELVEILTSNREVDGKHLVFTLAVPFGEVANRSENQYGGPRRSTARTCRSLLDRLTQIFRARPGAFQGDRRQPHDELAEVA